ncbi:DUF6285 domain-containing protein [Aquisalimonas sp.]|uniref:DUF6285 domain-containing protein n=1 Tax=unclassified Aquisalimonas TaxID=2644645 RepID=UPI0025B80FDB|nr:DUF6285 domain-containing protein [Aquisalimonas sp.]
MREQPGAEDLIAGVIEFLENDVVPATEGRLAFHTRVAARALAIVRREIEHGLTAELEERVKLEALLGRRGTNNTLVEQLCERIADGRIPLDSGSLQDYLWASTLNAMAVDQPNYSAYRRTLEELNESRQT